MGNEFRERRDIYSMSELHEIHRESLSILIEEDLCDSTVCTPHEFVEVFFGIFSWRRAAEPADKGAVLLEMRPYLIWAQD